MTKQEVKNILMTMRTPENESIINNLLGKLDMLNDNTLQAALDNVGNTEDDVRKYFTEQIAKKQSTQSEEKFPINEMFTYGISGDCVHLHMPVDLHKMISDKGRHATFDTVNLYLLDAIDKIKQLKDSNFYRLQSTNNIFMISPILYGHGLKFFESLDFVTNSYRKTDLKNNEFLTQNTEAQLATEIFGTDKNIASATISFDTISTPEWQDKKREKIEEFAKKGIVFTENLQEHH